MEGKQQLPYHPANHALSVTSVKTKPLHVVKPRRLTTSWKEIRSTADEPARAKVFHRLVKNCHLLPDPASEIIYPSSGKLAEDRKKPKKAVVHLATRCPITLPTCCQQHRREITRVVTQLSRLLYNSPEPIILPKIRAKNKLERLCEKYGEENRRCQHSLATLYVRWKIANTYDEDMLYMVLSQFGPVTVIHMTSPFMAHVTFADLETSCRVALQRYVGQDYRSRLRCYWLPQSMASRTLHPSGTTFRIVNNELLRPSLY